VPLVDVGVEHLWQSSDDRDRVDRFWRTNVLVWTSVYRALRLCALGLNAKRDVNQMNAFVWQEQVWKI